MDKKALRAEILAKLKNMTEDERTRSDDEIYNKIVNLSEFCAAKVIFLYISVGDEADTKRIFDYALKSGKRVCIPKCEAFGKMHAVEVFGKEDLIPDKFGIPSAREGTPTVLPEDIDFVIAPGVAFDLNGRRLGRGGGYYDRFLGELSAFTVGICHPCQLVSSLEIEDHDIPVNLVVTS